MTTRSALVTGGSRGIGLGIATRLLTDGYRVVVNGVRDREAVSKRLGSCRVSVISRTWPPTSERPAGAATSQPKR